MLSTWWTIVAFAGGTMPLLGLEGGSLRFGLFWLFVLGPVVMTVLYQVCLVVTTAVGLPVVAVRDRHT